MSPFVAGVFPIFPSPFDQAFKNLPRIQMSIASISPTPEVPMAPFAIAAEPRPKSSFQVDFQRSLGLPCHVGEDPDPPVGDLLEADRIDSPADHFRGPQEGQLIDPLPAGQMACRYLHLRNDRSSEDLDHPDFGAEVESGGNPGSEKRHSHSTVHALRNSKSRAGKEKRRLPAKDWE
jgi:hypothetical protein